MKRTRIAAIAGSLAAARRPRRSALAQSGRAAQSQRRRHPADRLDAAVKSRLAQGQPTRPSCARRSRDELINPRDRRAGGASSGPRQEPDVAAQHRPRPAGGARRTPTSRTTSRRTRSPTTRCGRSTSAQGRSCRRKEYRVAPHPGREGGRGEEASSPRLKKGGSFEKLAAEQSKDPGSQGPRRRPRLGARRALREAVRRRAGQAEEGPDDRHAGADPVRLARDPRSRTSAPTKVPRFEEVKPQLSSMLQEQVVQKAIADLRAKAKIE